MSSARNDSVATYNDSTQQKGKIDQIEHAPPNQVKADDVLHTDPTGAVMKGYVHDMSIDDRATALKLAQEQDPGPKTASWRYFQFVMMILVVCMCSGDNGFDGKHLLKGKSLINQEL